MKALIDQVSQFLVKQTIWMFLTVLMLVSILLIVESDPQTWTIYLSYFGFLCLLFAPVLIYSLYRRYLEQKLSIKKHRLLWFLCFIVYPFLLILSSSFLFMDEGIRVFTEYVGMSNKEDGTYAILASTSCALLFAEVAIQSNKFFSQKSKATQWFKNIGLETTILFLMLLFSMFLTTIDYVEVNDFPGGFWEGIKEIPFLLSTLIQFFIIHLIYYFFYLVNHYVLINKLLNQKGVIYYAFGLAGTILLFYPIAAQLIAWLPMINQRAIHPVVNDGVFGSVNASIPIIGMILSIPFILTVQWFKQRSEIATLDKEKSETELRLLKQQINPHFFFNTLNNLYALSIKKDQATPEVVLKLSDLMRYVIYKGKEELVYLFEEVNYLEDYVSLQKIRLHKQLDYQFEKEIENEHFQIPPLLFIILLENAFKHGIEPAENESFLHLYLKSKSNKLTFCCMNSFEEVNKNKPGIGMDNLKRRLDLLFPNNYTLEVEQNNYTFKAILEISFV